MRRRKIKRVWVSEDFAKKIQKEAIDEGDSLLDYTDKLANDGKTLKDRLKKNGWSF